MQSGKALRLRRIFSRGRAVIGLAEHGGADPVALVRALTRADADAVILSPGVLELVYEEVAELAVIVRLNTRTSPGTHMLSVQAALEMGAEAVLCTAAGRDPRDIENLARATEESRRLGMPVIAEIVGDDLLHCAELAAELGADMFQARSGASPEAIRAAVRKVARPMVMAPGDQSAPELIRTVHELLEAGVQGIVAGPESEAVLAAVRGMAHQGITMYEALASLN